MPSLNCARDYSLALHNTLWTNHHILSFLQDYIGLYTGRGLYSAYQY